MATKKLPPNERIVAGDMMEIDGNKKVVPAVATVGWTVGELYKYAGAELRGVYRPVAEGK